MPLSIPVRGTVPHGAVGRTKDSASVKHPVLLRSRCQTEADLLHLPEDQREKKKKNDLRFAIEGNRKEEDNKGGGNSYH